MQGNFAVRGFGMAFIASILVGIAGAKVITARIIAVAFDAPISEKVKAVGAGAALFGGG